MGGAGGGDDGGAGTGDGATDAAREEAETAREEVPREVASARTQEARVVATAAENAREAEPPAKAAVHGRPRLRLGAESGGGARGSGTGGGDRGGGGKGDNPARGHDRDPRQQEQGQEGTRASQHRVRRGARRAP